MSKLRAGWRGASRPWGRGECEAAKLGLVSVGEEASSDSLSEDSGFATPNEPGAVWAAGLAQASAVPRPRSQPREKGIGAGGLGRRRRKLGLDPPPTERSFESSLQDRDRRRAYNGPVPNRNMTGVVRFYKATEEYGFIETAFGDIHFRADCAINPLPEWEGHEVNFDAVPSDRRPKMVMAIHVRLSDDFFA